MWLFIINIFLFLGLCFVLLHFLAGEERHLSIIIFFAVCLWFMSFIVWMLHFKDHLIT